MEIFIKETAKRHGLTLTELGDKMSVSRQTIYFYIEQGSKNPLCKLEEIASAIGCDVNELFCEFAPEPNSIGGKHSCPHCGKPLNIKIE